MGQYGEILDAQKGFISKKLPGCTNGIWTVRLVMKAGVSLPPFLLMKDEGEVWQLATGESSVCWKCGQGGHIGDKCNQQVTKLAESIASPALGNQLSWAHVVKGGVSVVPSPPPPPPGVQARPGLFRNPYKATGDVFRAAKAALKKVKQQFENKKVSEVAAPALETPAVQAASMEVQVSVDQLGDDESILPDVHGYPVKKAKLSSEQDIPRDPRLRVKVPSNLPPSPDLHHKVPSGGDQRRGSLSGGSADKVAAGEDQRHGPCTGGGGSVAPQLPEADQLQGGCVLQVPVPVRAEQRHGDISEGGLELSEGVGKVTRTNLHGIKWLLWFDISIEGKDLMNPELEDRGGRIKFGFKEKNFSKEIDDFFLKFEDECSLPHKCFGRIKAVSFDMRNLEVEPWAMGYDAMNIIGLLEKYSDGHIIDSGCREVGEEEWFL